MGHPLGMHTQCIYSANRMDHHYKRLLTTHNYILPNDEEGLSCIQACQTFQRCCRWI